MQNVADILVRARSVGLTQVSREISNLYRTNQRQVAEMNTTMQQFGHHSFRALTIFRGLALYRGFGVLTAQMAEGVQAAIEFEKEMANVNSLLLESDENLRQYSNFAAKLGQQLPIALGDIARGMYDIASAGFTARTEVEAIAVLASKAAVAGVTDLKNAVQAGVGTMNAFGKTIGDLEHIYDVHFMTVKQGILTYEQLNQVMGRVTATASLAGQGMETAFAALVAISRGGFGGAAFAEGSTRVVRFFQELSNPSAQRDIEALGVAVFDSFGNMRNAIDIVTDLNKVLAESTEEVRQAQVRQIFTNIRSAQGFQVLSEQLDIWREAQMKNIFSAGAMESALDKQLKTVSASLTKLQNQFTDTMRGVVGTLAPMAEMLTRTMEPLISMVGILAIKYIVLGTQAKILAMIEKQHTLTMEREKQQLDLLNLKHQHRIIIAKTRIAIDMQANAMAQEGISIDMQKILMSDKELEAAIKLINQKIVQISKYQEEDAAVRRNTISKLEYVKAQLIAIANNKQDILSTLDNIKAKNALNDTLWLNRAAYAASAASMISMIGMMFAMNSTNEGLVKSYMSLTVFITTFSMTIQMLTPVINVLTKALQASAASGFLHAAGLSAAQGAMLGIIGVAGAVAATVGLAVYAFSELGKIADDAAMSLDDLESGMYDVSAAGDDMSKSVQNYVKELIRAGAVIDEIEKRINNLYGAYDTFGKSAALGLAKSGYANIGGTELMQVPTWAFPQTTENKTTFGAAIEGTDFEKAMQSAYFTFEDMKELWEGSPEAFLRVQEQLLDMSNEEMRNAFTTMIFGEQFGQSLISLWDDAGKKAALLAGDTISAATAAKDGMEDIANTITSKLLGTQVYTTGATTWERSEQIRDAFKQAGIESGELFIQKIEAPWFSMTNRQLSITKETFDTFMKSDVWENLKPTLKAEFMGGGWEAITQEQLDYFVQARLLTDEQYQAFMEVADRGMLTFEAMEEAITDFDTAIAGLKLLSGYIDSLKSIMDIGSAVEKMVEKGDALDEAGFHFKKVAGQWENLGNQWAEIQAIWESINVVNTFLSTFTAIRDLEIPEMDLTSLQAAATEGLKALAPSLEPLFRQMVGFLQPVIEGMSANFGDPEFWKTVMRSDEVVETVENGMDEMVNAVSDLSKLDDFVQTMVDAGIRLDEAGYHFGGVAGQWEQLGEEWRAIQKMWMGLEIMSTLLDLVTGLEATTREWGQTGTQTVQTGTEWVKTYVEQYTDRALKAQQELQVPLINYYYELMKQGQNIPYAMELVIKSLLRVAQETEQIWTGDYTPQPTYEEQPTYGWIYDEAAKAQLEQLREQLAAILLPLMKGMTGDAASGFMAVLKALLEPLAEPGFWDIIFDEMEDGVVKTIEEMAKEFQDMLKDTSDIGGAIDAMVEHSAILEEAGYYWKGVAGNWENLGAEWGRIQAYFKVTEFINSFIQSAQAMREFGITLPSMFQESMFTIMQNLANFVLPDFQNVINGLLDNIQSENFWSALAEGMAAADITQSNSIVLAPYIVISERADADEILEIVHDALVGEARRAGFTWGGG